MTQTPDMTTLFKDAMAAFPLDTSAANGAFKSSSDLNGKISAVALDAAEKSTKLTEQFTQDTLKGLSDVTKAKSAPADYMQAMTDFFTGYSKAATEQMTAFGDIARQAQTETLELLTAAGKRFGEDATAAAKTAGKDASAAVKTATAPAK